MKRFIMFLAFSILLTVGCASEEVDNQQDQVHTTEQTTVTNDTNEIETDTNASDEPDINTNEKKTDMALSPLTVHYIDAGQGDAALLTFADEEEEYAILYDAGDWQGNEVVPYLKSASIDYVDIVIISHPHADHIGQLADVLAEIDVGEVWMTGNTASSGVYERAAEAILQSDADYDEPIAGDVFDIGPLTAEVLHPSNSLTGDLNEDSLSVLFTYGHMEFLFTGDAYIEQEKAMLSRKEHLTADFLQLGHHGSKTSSGQEFLHTVDPTYAIYSAGDGNSYGHPHKEVLKRLDAMDAKVYGTDVHGTVIVTTDGDDTEISTERSGTVAAGTKEKRNEKESNAKKSTSPNSTDTKHTTPSNDCIDINHASKEQLQGIIHLGEKRAIEVIELRPFDAVEDLQRVNGIGLARITDIKSEQKACVGGS